MLCYQSRTSQRSVLPFPLDKCPNISRVQKLPLLPPHKNTKHLNLKNNKGDISVSTQEKSSKFHCDECEYTCQTKKNLKKHKAQNHVISTNSQDIKCENCGKKFSDQDELVILMEQSHPTCKCTADSVCDDCVDEWANKV